MADVLSELTAALPAGRVQTDADLLAGYAHDEAEWAPHGTAAALVRPHSEDEIATLVRICAAHGTPVVPRGAGTGLRSGKDGIRGERRVRAGRRARA